MYGESTWLGDAWQTGGAGGDGSIGREHTRYENACRDVVYDICKDGAGSGKVRGAVAGSVVWCGVAVVFDNQTNRPLKNGWVFG